MPTSVGMTMSGADSESFISPVGMSAALARCASADSIAKEACLPVVRSARRHSFETTTFTQNTEHSGADIEMRAGQPKRSRCDARSDPGERR
jgi:glutamine cyclotransferase